ncbi:hypothetical protein GCM10027579_07980 [Calidifontibacter terrae]
MDVDMEVDMEVELVDDMDVDIEDEVDIEDMPLVEDAVVELDEALFDSDEHPATVSIVTATPVRADERDKVMGVPPGIWCSTGASRAGVCPRAPAVRCTRPCRTGSVRTTGFRRRAATAGSGPASNRTSPGVAPGRSRSAPRPAPRSSVR